MSNRAHQAAGTAPDVSSTSDSARTTTPDVAVIEVVPELAAQASLPTARDHLQRFSSPQRHQAVLAIQRRQGNAVATSFLQRRSDIDVAEPADIARAPTSEAPTATVQRGGPEDEAKEAEKKAYEAATPTPLATIDDLIKLIERVEAAYSSETWQGITTRIRKSYYDDSAWDLMIKNRKGYPGVATPPISVSDFKALANAKQHPEIVVGGERIDIGHVFTGIDAMNFPETGGKIWASRVDGPPGATWGGDIGSALAEWDINSGSDRNKRNDYYNQYASKDDMLGDVDGIALAKQTVGAQQRDTLSARLRAFYLGAGGNAASVSKRFTKFTQASGFTWTGAGGGIKLNDAARSTIRGQVDNFGVAWRRRKEGVLGGAGQNWFHAEDLDWFVDRFIRWVEQGLAAENP